MKTFEITKSIKGNLVIINHHAKPTKEVHVYDENGKFLNNVDEQAFNGVRFYEGSSNIQGETIPEAVLNYINAIAKRAAAKAEKLANEVFGNYEVDLEIIKLEGKSQYITLIVKAENSESAKAIATYKFWEKPSWDAIQSTAKSANYID